MLWAGNVEWDGLLKYSGADNDRDPILQTIGGSVPTITIDGLPPAGREHGRPCENCAGSQNDRDAIAGTSVARCPRHAGGAGALTTRSGRCPGGRFTRDVADGRGSAYRIRTSRQQ